MPSGCDARSEDLVVAGEELPPRHFDQSTEGVQRVAENQPIVVDLPIGRACPTWSAFTTTPSLGDPDGVTTEEANPALPSSIGTKRFRFTAFQEGEQRVTFREPDGRPQCHFDLVLYVEPSALATASVPRTQVMNGSAVAALRCRLSRLVRYIL